jgi:hypothetical protein
MWPLWWKSDVYRAKNAHFLECILEYKHRGFSLTTTAPYPQRCSAYVTCKTWIEAPGDDAGSVRLVGLSSPVKSIIMQLRPSTDADPYRADTTSISIEQAHPNRTKRKRRMKRNRHTIIGKQLGQSQSNTAMGSAPFREKGYNSLRTVPYVCIEVYELA